MLTMTAAPPGDWLSSVIALTLAAACDQPDGCKICSLSFLFVFLFFFLFTGNGEWDFCLSSFSFFAYSFEPSVSVIFFTLHCSSI